MKKRNLYKIPSWLIVFLTVLGLFMAFTPKAHSVEVLVKASEHWQQFKDIPIGTTQDTLAWLKDMWKQTHKGEIIVVKPNGWVWGGMENPPRFVIIKIPDATMAQAAKYLDMLEDTLAVVESDSVMLKERRWHFLRKVVDSAMVLWSIDQSYVTLTNSQATNVVKEYDLAAIKQKIIDRLR